jgi:hypothetical protein
MQARSILKRQRASILTSKQKAKSKGAVCTGQAASLKEGRGPILTHSAVP